MFRHGDFPRRVPTSGQSYVFVCEFVKNHESAFIKQMSNSHLEKIDKIASKISSSPLVASKQDFTIFTTDAGDKVKTTERICKGNFKF